jgi:hypothetical protein
MKEFQRFDLLGTALIIVGFAFFSSSLSYVAPLVHFMYVGLPSNFCQIGR